MLGVIVGLGLLVRGAHILASDFPLNDGGLFYAMARDIQASHYVLPTVTSYNGAQIPFAYPPLGFYIAALLDDWTPFALIDLFRVLPLLYSTLTIAAFALLARRLLASDRAALLATAAFALVPRSFIWLLMGGGVARGLGLLLALLALHEVHRLYTTGHRRYIVSAALLSAGTLLAHLETAWFLAFSIGICFAAYGRTREQLLNSAVLAASAAMLAAPWWLTAMTSNGLVPFRYANAAGGSVFTTAALARELLLALARVTSTSEPLFPLIGALGLLGAVIAIRTRHVVLPIWWVAIILLDARAFPTFATIPVAMLAGLALERVVLPLGRSADTRTAFARDLNWRRLARGSTLIGAVLLSYAVMGALLRTPGLGGEGHFLTGLTPAERSTFEWIESNTPETSRIFVVPSGPWQADREAEWLPVLASRVSVTTVQGSEWTARFATKAAAADRAWTCGYRQSDCLTQWSDDFNSTITHVYIPTTERGQCCGSLLESLRQSSHYTVVHEGAGGTIFAVRGATFPSPPLQSR